MGVCHHTWQNRKEFIDLSFKNSNAQGPRLNPQHKNKLINNNKSITS
jgi:hypothetical protein